MHRPHMDSPSSSGRGAGRPTPAAVLALGLKGLLMGVADIIPGVSGGTVALIVGVYGRLIEGIRSFRPATVLALLRAVPGVWDAGRRPQLWAAAKGLHLDFLLPLGAGVVTAVLVAARFIPGLLQRYPAQMNALFFGLIIVSVYVPWSRMPKRGPQHLLMVAVAAAAAFWVVGLPVMRAGESGLPFVFVSGAVAICAMILPGVSGSYMLKAMGQYEHILNALNGRDVVTIGVFLLGIAVGITSFVRVLAWLLRRHEAMTLATLTGLMVGSLRSVWPFREPLPGGGTHLYLPATVGAFELTLLGIALLGAAIVAGLIVADRKLGRPSPPGAGANAPAQDV
jgi:putative membrane protein